MHVVDVDRRRAEDVRLLILGNEPKPGEPHVPLGELAREERAVGPARRVPVVPDVQVAQMYALGSSSYVEGLEVVLLCTCSEMRDLIHHAPNQAAM